MTTYNRMMTTQTNICSLWTKLPKTVIDLIFAFDNSYHDYMKLSVFHNSNTNNSNLPKDSLFYKSIMDQRYGCHSYQSDILQILHLRSSIINPLYPQWYELRTIRNYTMITPASLCMNDRIIRKLIFEYNDSIHWYICVDTEIDFAAFMNKFLSPVHIEFLAFSDILLFNHLNQRKRYLVGENSGSEIRRNFNWIKKKKFIHAAFSDFDIIIKNQVFEIDVLNIFQFNRKIYLNLQFDNNHLHFYEENKYVYDMFIYYVNMRLRPYF